MSTFDAGSIESRLTVDRSEFTRALDQAKADADKFSGKDITVKVKADTATADKGLTGTQGRSDKLGKSTPTVKVGVSNDSANRQLDDTQAKADRLGKTSASVKVDANGAKDAGSWMATLVGAATAVAPAMAVAGVGVAAFGALAVPTIAKVVKAQTDMATGAKGAAVEYANLSASQKTMVAGITLLEGSYKRLSVAVQPQVMKVFNEALTTADTILPHLVPLAKAGGDAVAYLVHTLGSVTSDPQARQFGQFLGQEIGPDMQALAGLIPPVVHLLESMITDLNPLAVATLHFASGLVSVVNSLSRAAPWLTDTAAAALVLYKPVAAIIGLDIGGKFTAMAAGVAKAKDAFTAATTAAKAAAAVDAAFAAEQTTLTASTVAFAVASDGTAVAVDALTVSEEAAAVAGATLAAVNPLVWVGLAIAAVAGLVIGLDKLSSGSERYYQQVIQQNQGTGFAVQSYNAAAAAIGRYDEQQQKAVVNVVNLHTGAQQSGQSVGNLAAATVALTAAQQRQVTEGRNISAYLTDLQNRYHVTRDQAIAFANGAGVTADEVAKGGNSAQQAARQTQTYVDAMVAASGTGKTLQANLDVLAAKTDTTTAAVQNLNSAWDAFLGIGTGLQGSFLTLEGNLAGISKAASAAGASMGGTNANSQALQQAFQQGLSGVGAYADAMRTAGTNQGTFNSNLKLALAPLAQYAQGNSAATAQLAALARAAGYTGPDSLKKLESWLGSSKGAMDRLKSSTDAQTAAASRLSDASAHAASVLQSSFITQVASAGLNSTASVKDVNALAGAIQSTGTKSSATSGARAQLIKDLVASGVGAQKAAGLVDGFIKKLGQIPASKTVNLKESASGTWSLSEVNAGTGKQKEAAAGWYVSGGTAGRDSVPVLTMPGELIVPTKMVQAGAVDHLRGQIPGFASGGLVGGSYSGTAPGLGQWSLDEYNASVAAMTKQLETAAGNAAKAAKSTAAASGGGPGGPGARSVAGWASVILSALGMLGQPASWLNTVERRMNQESGGNPTIVNKTDSNWQAGHPSVGLMQVIAGTFASYAGKFRNTGPFEYGVSTNPLANTYAGLNYALHRYGSLSALNRAGGYAKGTDGAAAGWALTGEQGPELVQFHGGETVLPAHVTSAVLGGSQMPGYAKGTSNAASLAGIISGAPNEGWSKDVSGLKSDLKIIATSLGIKGLSKADASKLKGEQGKDENELLVATAYLGKLQAAKKQITTVTEPQLRKQINALNGLSKIGKLSAAENRLLKTLKASLASQQAKLGRINVAISGKAVAKPKPAAGSADDGGGGDAGGGDSGSASTTTNPTPVVGAANITLGAASAYGGSQFTLTPTSLPGTGTFSGVPAGSAHQLPGGFGAPAQPQQSGVGAGGNGKVEQLLAELIHATHSIAPGVAGGMGAAMSGAAQSAYFAQRYPRSGY